MKNNCSYSRFDKKNGGGNSCQKDKEVTEK